WNATAPNAKGGAGKNHRGRAFALPPGACAARAQMGKGPEAAARPLQKGRAGPLHLRHQRVQDTARPVTRGGARHFPLAAFAPAAMRSMRASRMPDVTKTRWMITIQRTCAGSVLWM